MEIRGSFTQKLAVSQGRSLWIFTFSFLFVCKFKFYEIEIR